MIYLFENPDNLASIIYDESILSDADKAKGVAVDALPEKENIEGKVVILKVRKSTGEVWYEYEDASVDVDDEVNVLKAQLQVLEAKNVLLEAQNNALSERADFIEDVVAEMAEQVYQ